MCPQKMTLQSFYPLYEQNYNAIITNETHTEYITFPCWISLVGLVLILREWLRIDQTLHKILWLPKTCSLRRVISTSIDKFQDVITCMLVTGMGNINVLRLFMFIYYINSRILCVCPCVCVCLCVSAPTWRASPGELQQLLLEWA